MNFKSVVKVVLYKISDAQPEIQLVQKLQEKKAANTHCLQSRLKLVECGKDKFFLNRNPLRNSNFDVFSKNLPPKLPYGILPISGPSEGLKIRGCHYYLVGIISHPWLTG